jgi:multiple sugar transport system substrate-binding protein
MVRKTFLNVRLGAVALAVAASMVLAAACVGNDAAPPQAGPSAGETIAPPTEDTTITFASWVGQSVTMKHLAEAFHKEYPTITVEFQSVPAEQATQKLLTQVAGGTAPDTAFMDMSAVTDFASRNALVDLTDYIAQSQYVNPDDYVDAWKQGAQYEGKWFGLPFDGETTGLFYRTDLFEAAGIDGPPTTWDELEADAAKLTDPSKNQYGFILFAPESAYYWYPFLWQAGGDLFNNDTKQVEFDSDAGRTAAEFYVGLRQYSPPDFFNSNSWDGRVAFAEGKVGMYVAGSWFAGEMTTSFPKIDGKWDSAPLPEGPAGCATTIAGDTLVVFNQTQNVDAAWLWLEFLSRPDNLLKWNVTEEGSTLLPPVASLLNDPAIFEAKPVLKGFAENMKCGVTNAIETNKWSQIEENLNEQLGAAIYGDISPDEALDKAASEAADILNK